MVASCLVKLIKLLCHIGASFNVITAFVSKANNEITTDLKRVEMLQWSMSLGMNMLLFLSIVYFSIIHVGMLFL